MVDTFLGPYLAERPTLAAPTALISCCNRQIHDELSHITVRRYAPSILRDPTYVANVTVQGCEAKRRMAQAIALSWIQTPMIPPKYIKSIYVNLHAYVTGGMIIYWARGGGESAYMLQHLLDRFFAHGISFTEGANTQRPEYIEELNINLTTVVCDATSETFCSGYYSIQKTLKHMLLADDGALHERLGTVSMYVNGEVQQRWDIFDASKV